MSRILSLSLVAKFAVAIAAAWGVLSCESLARAEQRGTLVVISDLPPVAQAAAKKAAGPVDWLVGFRFERPSVWYRLAGHNSRKELVKVTVQATGDIIDVRTDVPVKAVPEAVMKEIARNFPHFQAKTAESAGKTVGLITSYVVEGTDDDKPRTVRVVLEVPVAVPADK